VRTWPWIFVGLGVAATVAHGGEPDVARGAKLLEPFKAELQQALRQGLARGPVEAITACQLRAPEIAKDLSQGNVRLGRTSHRLRNPANAPPSWVSPILEAYLANPSEQTPTTVRLPNEKSGYVEPIPLQPLCLACHGSALAPDVAARIDELYPEDQAVGFEVGELRGVFWIEFFERTVDTSD